MTLGLAAMSAWGVEHFQVLTSGLEFPILQPGESSASHAARLERYAADLNTVGLTVFRNFFRAAAIISLAAIPFALDAGPAKAAGLRAKTLHFSPLLPILGEQQAD